MKFDEREIMVVLFAGAKIALIGFVLASLS